MITEAQTVEDFGAATYLPRADVEHLRSVFMAVENGDIGLMKSLGIKDSEVGDVKFFLEKLIDTGFLDWAEKFAHYRQSNNYLTSSLSSSKNTLKLSNKSLIKKNIKIKNYDSKLKINLMKRSLRGKKVKMKNMRPKRF